jgi:hypothetical protein
VKGAALAAAATALGFGLVVLSAAGPRDPSRAAAVFPPWWSETHILTAAASAGDIVARGGLANVVLVKGDPATLQQRLRSAGAWLLLDPLAAGICGPSRGQRP